MPYILSPLITERSQGMWFEGNAYAKNNNYSIQDVKLPPVNYDQHLINSHSLTHIEAPKHVDNNGKTVDEYFLGNYFYGKCVVVRLKGNHYKEVGEGIYHWEVSLKELQSALNDKVPKKLLLTTDEYKKNNDGFHDPNFVLTLSQEASDWLVESSEFNLYGTSWKSSDFLPGSSERPIHKTLFKQAIILENLDLENVPEGEYLLNCYPIRIKGASESPVTPVLFTKEELLAQINEF